jgi:hypothetical protein
MSQELNIHSKNAQSGLKNSAQRQMDGTLFKKMGGGA